MGVGNDSRYQNDRTFDPFPFPAVLTDPGGDTSPLAELGERLDAFRKERLEALPELTMTKLYNALERFREAMNGGELLTEAERELHDRALVAILAELHDDIDRETLAAYGWSDVAAALVGKPGGTTPSNLKSEEQLAAEEELLSRLVALNQERTAEEKRGLVRWLRPDYQIPKLGHKVAAPEEQLEADVAVVPVAERPPWPAALPRQIEIVRDLLARTEAPAPPSAISAAFDGRNTARRRQRVEELLESLVATGNARSGETGSGERRYFAIR